MKDGSKVVYPGVYVKDRRTIANFILYTASTGETGKVGKIQVSPVRPPESSK